MVQMIPPLGTCENTLKVTLIWYIHM
jgi:hypothetical protein